ncbi:hypothetical protein GQ600_4838 [Phytophthora cactorum]|nr:hypothetical protein GQ600_4838 [Phytophthora cactorum]
MPPVAPNLLQAQGVYPIQQQQESLIRLQNLADYLLEDSDSYDDSDIVDSRAVRLDFESWSADAICKACTKRGLKLKASMRKSEQGRSVRVQATFCEEVVRYVEKMIRLYFSAEEMLLRPLAAASSSRRRLCIQGELAGSSTSYKVQERAQKLTSFGDIREIFAKSGGECQRLHEARDIY